MINNITMRYNGDIIMFTSKLRRSSPPPLSLMGSFSVFMIEIFYLRNLPNNKYIIGYIRKNKVMLVENVEIIRVMFTQV